MTIPKTLTPSYPSGFCHTINLDDIKDFDELSKWFEKAQGVASKLSVPTRIILPHSITVTSKQQRLARA